MSARADEGPRAKLDFLYSEVLGEVDQLVQRLADIAANLTANDQSLRGSVDTLHRQLQSARMGHLNDLERFNGSLDKTLQACEARWQKHLTRSVSRIMSAAIIAGATAGGIAGGAIGILTALYMF